MHVYSAGAIAAFEKGDAITAGAVEFASTPPLRLWGGYGMLNLGGNDFAGTGDKGLVTVLSGALGDSEQNITLSLSGVDPDIAGLITAADVQRTAVAIWELIFDGSGTVLLDAHVHTRGRLDTLPMKERVGGEAALEANIETAARGLGRAGQRMRSDADQRLVDASDGGFRAVSYAGVKTLYWGGKPPSTTGAAVGGGGGQGGGFNEYKSL